MAAVEVASPCKKTCDLVDGVCSSCGRTLEEIIRWTSYTDEDRKYIMKDLKRRKKQYENKA